MGEIMKKLLFFTALFIMSCFFEACGKRIVVDSDATVQVRRRPVTVINQAVPCKETVCTCDAEHPQYYVCDGERPDSICCNKNRVKSEFFKYGPYTYPYIYNQPGFYFGTGIPKIHYW